MTSQASISATTHKICLILYSNSEKIINLAIAGPSAVTSRVNSMFQKYLRSRVTLNYKTAFMCTSRNLEKCGTTFPREQNSWISTIFLDMKRLKRSTGYRFVSESTHAQESHTCQFCPFFLCHICRTIVSWDPDILLPWQRDVTTSSLLSWNGWSRDGWSWKNLNHVSWVKEKPQSLGQPLYFFWHDALTSSLILWFG